MRIHGTFVNFLNLSHTIRQDIIRHLDPASASLLKKDVVYCVNNTSNPL